MPELSARVSAASFVHFLYERYGGEKYFQVHRNIGQFYAVFGRTIEEMILEWHEFLAEYAAAMR